MKQVIKNCMPLLLLILVLAGCRKSYSDLNTNANQPTSVPPSLLLTCILNDMYDAPFQQNEIRNQYYLYNYDYYGNNRYDFGSATMYYNTLKNVTKMEEEATKSGAQAVNPYEALGKFFRAYFFVKMSLQVGDIPMTQALAGINNLTPVYDPQKKVFQQALVWLDSANIDIKSIVEKGNTTIGGDIYLGNDIKRWQKVINTFKLRVLIHLSKKEADTDLNIKQQFANIVSNPSQYPIMTDGSDDLQYVYLNPTNYYPNNPSNFGFDGSRNNMCATHIGLLTQLNDPRVFVVAEPSRYKVDSLGVSPTSFAAFIGADAGQDLGIMYNNAGLQRYSFLNRKHFYSTFTAENSIQIGYAEMCFNIAEAINRGWISGKIAEDYYVAGIKASMKFYGIPETGQMTAYFYRPGSTAVDNIQNYDTYQINTNWATYYAQASVKYAGNTAAGLTQILQQKYLALFRHSGLETFYTNRRTGVPVFNIGPGTGNSNRIATRFKYPGSESSANTTNYQAALQTQYAGNDDINGVMWILK